jgi:hypothetical protein
VKSRKAQSLRKSLRKSRARRDLAQRRGQLERLETRLLLAADLPSFGSDQFMADFVPENTHILEGYGDQLSLPSSNAPEDIARNYLETHAGEYGLERNDIEFRVSSSTISSVSSHRYVYLQQTFNGLDIIGAVANFSLQSNGQIVSGATSFVPLPATADTVPAIDPAGAVDILADTLNIAHANNPAPIGGSTGLDQATGVSFDGNRGGSVPTRLVYVPTADGRLELGWDMQVIPEDRIAQYQAVVSEDGTRVLRIEDQAWAASYNVFALPISDPDNGVQTLVVDPEDPIASPFGWHDTNAQPGAEFTDTRGNNVHAQEDLDDDDLLGQRPNGGASLIFNDVHDPTLNVSDPQNIDAATTQGFYTVNRVHDVLFHHGFDEIAGNFQGTNYSSQGQGGDPIVLDSIDLGAQDNAFFFPSVEGIPARIAMGETTITSPMHGTVYDSAIVAHEYGHGLVSRLVGGPANIASVPGQEQPGGLNEGWSDWLGLVFTQDPSHDRNTPRPLGEYSFPSLALGNPLPDQGSRSGVYSVDLAVGSQTILTNYATTGLDVHFTGEVWASALWDAHWFMIERYGFDADLAQGVGGNTAMMELVTEGMKLTPAIPSFIQARDALLQADVILNKGVNLDILWEAFVRRGIGYSATGGAGLPTAVAPTPGFDVPPNNLRSTISGTVYSDFNGDGSRSGIDTPLAGVSVYIDVNENGRPDVLEPTAVSAADGTYSFEFLIADTFTIRQIDPTGFIQTEPANNQDHTVIVIPGIDQTNVDFGNEPGGGGGFGGIVYNDIDEDGNLDPGEPGIGGVTVYVDLNQNDRLDFSEPATRTASDGSYSIPVNREGDFDVRIAVPTGRTLTAPLSGEHNTTVGFDLVVTGLEFGLTGEMLDFGDGPAMFPTLFSEDGARHRILEGFHLGANLDAEGDGLESATALGDDTTGSDDDDGIIFSTNITAGQSATVNALVSLNSMTPGFLQGFIDFNQNGSWDDVGEHVIVDRRLGENLTTGTPVSFTVPSGALTGPTYAMFRYGWERGIGSTGEAFAGEVEVYPVNVFGDVPVANDDLYTGVVVQDQPSPTNLDVLTNDFASSVGISIAGVSATMGGPFSSTTLTTNGGIITVVGAGVDYTPAPGFFGDDIFYYQVTDGTNTDEAMVTVNVAPLISGPAAVDDFVVGVDADGGTPGFQGMVDVNVTANDFLGPAHTPTTPTVLLSVTDPDPSTGTFSIFDQGTSDPTDDVVRFVAATPAPPLGTIISAIYTIRDNNGATDTASVTVQLGNDTTDDVMHISLGFFNPNTGAPITTADVGSQFELRAFVEDIRPERPGGGDDSFSGIFSAYFDVAMTNGTLGTFVGTPQPTAFYPEGFTGDTNTPDLVNEAGGIQPITIGGMIRGHGLGPIHIWSQIVRADMTGLLTFQPNPGDVTALETLLFDPAVLVADNQIDYQAGSILITGGSPEGEMLVMNPLHNASHRSDTNNSGTLSIADVLVSAQGVVYSMNQSQSEGEMRNSFGGLVYLDSTNDGRITASDLLTVLTDVRNELYGGLGEAEGSFNQPLGLVDQEIVRETPVAPVAPTTTQTLASVDDRRTAVQIIDVQGPVTREIIPPSEFISQSIESRWHAEIDESLSDELLDEVGAAWQDNLLNEE